MNWYAEFASSYFYFGLHFNWVKHMRHQQPISLTAELKIDEVIEILRANTRKNKLDQRTLDGLFVGDISDESFQIKRDNHHQNLIIHGHLLSVENKTTISINFSIEPISKLLLFFSLAYYF